MIRYEGDQISRVGRVSLNRLRRILTKRGSAVPARTGWIQKARPSLEESSEEPSEALIQDSAFVKVKSPAQCLPLSK